MAEKTQREALGELSEGKIAEELDVSPMDPAWREFLDRRECPLCKGALEVLSPPEGRVWVALCEPCAQGFVRPASG